MVIPRRAALTGVLVAVLAATGVGVAALMGRGGDSQPPAMLVANGTVLADSIEPNAAISRASAHAGFEVRIPTHLPPGLVLDVVRATADPIGANAGGSEGPFGWIRFAELVYQSEDGRLLLVTQSPPEREAKHAAGQHPEELDTGLPDVRATMTQGPTHTSIAWDSDDASYFLTYSYHDGSHAATAADELVAVAKSMR